MAENTQDSLASILLCDWVRSHSTNIMLQVGSVHSAVFFS